MRWADSTFLVALLVILTSPAGAITIHDEAFDGDLSDDRLAPTAFVLAAGASEIIGSVVAGDRDFWSIVVPSGHTLTAINVLDYIGAGSAFTAIQGGPTMTVDPDDFSAVGLLGFALFGDGEEGSDILAAMGTAGAGSDGFVPPLGAGTYSIWTQETSSTASDYVLSYVVTPEPGAAALLAFAAAIAARGRRRS